MLFCQQTIRLKCRVIGCTAPHCMAGNVHYCKTCGIFDVTHHSYECPTLNKNTQNNNSFLQPIIYSDIFNTNTDSCKKQNIYNNTTSYNPKPNMNNNTTSYNTKSNINSNTTSYNTYPKPNTNSMNSSVNNNIPSLVNSLNINTNCHTVCTMSVLTKRNGILQLIVSMRGDTLPGNRTGTMITTGGTRDHNESDFQCAVRECYEEHGIRVTKNNIVTSYDQTCNNGLTIMNYVAYIENVVVNGPKIGYEHEIESRNHINQIVSNYKDMWNDKIWMVSFSDLLKGNKYNKSNLKYIVDKMRIDSIIRNL